MFPYTGKKRFFMLSSDYSAVQHINKNKCKEKFVILQSIGIIVIKNKGSHLHLQMN